MRRGESPQRPLPKRLPPKPPPKWPRQINDPILARIWRAGGFKGKPPPVYLEPRMEEMGYQSGRNVYLHPQTLAKLREFPLKPQRGALGLQVLLHEYAHSRQPRVFPGNRMEAGAETWSQMASRRAVRNLLGPNAARRYKYPPRVYQEYIRGLRGSPGWPSFVRRGQFGK